MALVGAAVVGVTSLSLAKANSIAINSMSSNKVALQAQQYALAKGELIRATKYTELAAQAKTNIQNSNGFQDEVVVGTESAVDSTTRKKDVTVKVYKSGETLPRSSIIVTRYNKSLDSSSIPSGTILPWYGALGSIPSGFVLCNGSNGTPDLRDRFLVGAGYSYNLGNTGGANTVTLNTNQIPSHAHTRGTMEISGQIWAGWMGGNGAFKTIGHAGASGDGNAWVNDKLDFYASRTWTGATSYVGGSQAHENRPPYFAVYYIMKL